VLVMFEVTDLLKALVASDPDFVRVLVRTALQEVLEAEMSERSGRPRANGRRVSSAIGRGITAGRWSRVLASWSCACRS
jgi:transposase-like protein